MNLVTMCAIVVVFRVVMTGVTVIVIVVRVSIRIRMGFPGAFDGARLARRNDLPYMRRGKVYDVFVPFDLDSGVGARKAYYWHGVTGERLLYALTSRTTLQNASILLDPLIAPGLSMTMGGAVCNSTPPSTTQAAYAT